MMSKSYRFYFITAVLFAAALLQFSFSKSTQAQVPTATLLPRVISATPILALLRILTSITAYSGPSADFSIVGEITPGTQVQILAIFEDGLWLVVRLSGGIVGWIELKKPPEMELAEGAQILRGLPVVGTPTPTGASEARGGETVTAVATFTPLVTNTLSPISTSTLTSSPRVHLRQDVNIYALPDLNSPVLAILSAGTTADILGISSDLLWLQIPVAEKSSGWVSSSVLLVTILGDLSLVTIVETPPATPANTAVATLVPSSTETVMSVPTATLKPLQADTPLPTENAIQLLSQTEMPTATETLRVLPTIILPTETTTATLAPPPTLDLTATALSLERAGVVAGDSQSKYVRAEPNTSAAVVTSVSRGTAVTVIGNATNDPSNPNLVWYRIRLADGTLGWMRSDVVDVMDDSTPTPTPTGTMRTFTRLPTSTPSVQWVSGTMLMVINPNSVWLRESPNSSGYVVTLAYQTTVTATGNSSYDGNQWWWEVQASWGPVGWVEQYSLSPA